MAKSAQSSGLANSVSSCKGTQGHSQEGEALELRLVLAPSPAGLCSAMPDPGTVPGQLGGGSAWAQCLAVLGAARGHLGTLTTSTTALASCWGTPRAGPLPLRLRCVLELLRPHSPEGKVGTAGVCCGHSCRAVGADGIRSQSPRSPPVREGDLLGNQTNWLCKTCLLCRVAAVLSSLRAIKWL